MEVLQASVVLAAYRSTDVPQARCSHTGMDRMAGTPIPSGSEMSPTDYRQSDKLPFLGESDTTGRWKDMNTTPSENIRSTTYRRHNYWDVIAIHIYIKCVSARLVYLH